MTDISAEGGAGAKERERDLGGDIFELIWAKNGLN